MTSNSISVTIDGVEMNVYIHSYTFHPPDYGADNPEDFYGTKEIDVDIEDCAEKAIELGISPVKLHNVVEQWLFDKIGYSS